MVLVVVVVVIFVFVVVMLFVVVVTFIIDLISTKDRQKILWIAFFRSVTFCGQSRASRFYSEIS